MEMDIPGGKDLAAPEGLQQNVTDTGVAARQNGFDHAPRGRMKIQVEVFVPLQPVFYQSHFSFKFFYRGPGRPLQRGMRLGHEG